MADPRRTMALGVASDLSYLKYQAMPRKDLDNYRPRPVSSSPAPDEEFIPLPTGLPTHLGTLAQVRRAVPGPAAGLTPAMRLTSLLYYGSGLLRWEPLSAYQAHRAYPSPRSAFPTCVYLGLPDGAPWSEGIYAYDPIRHQLRQRTNNPAWAALESALGISCDTADAALIVGADFSRLTAGYGDFAYNLCSLEAGHAAASLALLGLALGYTPAWHFRFDDAALRSLLGCTSIPESPLVAVTLHRHAEFTAMPAVLEATQETPFPDVPGAPRISAMERSSGIMGRVLKTLTFPSGELVEDPEGAGPDLYEVLMRRTSGWSPRGLTSQPLPLSLSVVMEAIRNCRVSYLHDLDAIPEVNIYMVANRVIELDPGVYRYTFGSTQFLPVRLGDAKAALQQAYSHGSDLANLHTLPCAIFLTVNHSDVVDLVRTRGYRIANLICGAMAQGICLGFAAHDRFSRPVRAFHDARADDLTELFDGSQVAYGLLVGIHRHRAFSFDLTL